MPSLACFLIGDSALAQTPAPQKAEAGTLTIDPTQVRKPWTGDLAWTLFLARKFSCASHRAITRSLVALNTKFASEKKSPVTIKEAPENLKDEDLLEILNAGLIAIIVVDKHKADFWKQIFPKLTVHDNVAVRTGGRSRVGDPQRQPAAQGDAGR